ncbi:UvrD-helicase domain-containing protein [Kitasatospora sp. NPDC094028]
MPHDENRTAPAGLEVKVTRRPWNPALHPRDSKGRFVETGGIARLWGGGLARVLRALAGDKVLVERLDSGEREKLYANRLTMVSRPDGSAPTASEDKVLAEDAKREVQASTGGRGDGITKPDAGDPRVQVKPHDKGDDEQHIPDEKPTVTSTVESWRRGDVRPLAADAEQPQDARVRAEAARERAGAISSAQLTESGRHMVGREDGQWRVYEAATGRVHERQHGSKREALRAAEDLESGPIHKQEGWQSYTREELERAAEKAGPPKGPAREQPGHRRAAAREIKPGEFVVAGNPNADGGWYTRRVLDVKRDGDKTTLTWEGHGGRKETLAVVNGGAADGFELVGHPYSHERWERDHGSKVPSARIEAEARARHRQAATPEAQGSGHDGADAQADIPERGRRRDGHDDSGDQEQDASEQHGPRSGGWLPAGQAAPRRFRTVRDVRYHWDDGSDPTSADSAQADKDRQSAFKVVQLTSNEQLSTNGRFMVTRTPKGKYVVHHSGTGILIQSRYGDGSGNKRSLFSTKREALLVANAAEQVRNDRGELFDWDAPHLRDRLDGTEFVDAFDRAIKDARELENDEGRGAAVRNRGGDQSEPVRADREGVLADVPAGGDGGDGAGRDGVLRADRRGGGDADRGDLGGHLRRSGADRRDGGSDRAGEHGEDAGSGGGAARADLQRAEGGRDGGSGHAEGVAAADRGRVVLGSPEEEENAPTWRPPADGRSLVPSTVPARVKANIEAVRVLRRLEAEQRPGTPQEQAVLARWSGWGATPQVFVDSPSGEFAPLARELRSLLSDEDWERAADSTMNAHYTDPQIVQSVWGALRDLGFDGGEVLEPGAGSGNFIGNAPEGAHVTGVEVDPITAGIAKALYPHAEIRAEGFEKTHLPDGTFDATVGNVPFGAYEVVDLRHNKGNHRIHNAFILKSLDLTRPGGIVAVVTSRYTMDGSSVRAEDARMEMARKADLLGAIRLPSGTHRRTAGTDVVTDLLIFRRRDGEKEFTTGRDRKRAIKPLEERGPSDPPMWVHSAPAEGLPGQDPEEPVTSKDRVFLNPYFADNPDRVLGQMAIGHGLNRANDLRVDGDGHLAPALERALKDVVDQAKADGLAYRKDSAERRKPRLLEPGSNRVDGHVQVEEDGTLTQVRDGQVHPFDVPKSQAEEAKALLGLRDALKALVAAENAPENDEPLIERLRTGLKARYDAYHQQHGAINRFEWKVRKATDPETGEQIDKAVRHRPPRGGLFTKDPTMSIVKALDSFDAENGTSSPASIFTRRAGRHRTLPETADSPQDAAVLVHERIGHLDLDELAKVMRTTPDEARARLLAARSVDPVTGEEMPLVFELPGDGDLEMAADYLSGNVRAKLNEANDRAGTDPRFRVNVEHLEQVLPPDIPAGEIDAPLGASWLGAKPVQAFLNELMPEPVKVEYQGGSLWKVEANNRVKGSTAARTTWGTEDYPATTLVEAILTNRKIQVRRRNEDGSSYVDTDATDLAQAKAEELAERFQDWLWEDPKRAAEIKKVYNDTHNNLALRSYDGQRRTMPGLAENFKPHDHQHAAVARMVNEPAVLLAHEVGAGKTAEMAMGVMELRRLGLASKPVIVVPGHMLQQFHDEFLELYPDAKLLAAGSDDLTGRKRREFIARVATTDADAVILTQRAFESIDMRPEAQLAYIEREKASLKRALARAKGERNVSEADRPAGGRETRMVKEIRKRLKNLEAKIEKKTSAMKDKAGLSFEDTGIDYVVVDEAHHYKNLATNSSIPGAAIEGSNRASDLDMKLDYLRGKTKSGRVVTFATATPISNSVTEAHTMLRYLRPDLLERARIRDFDEFASTYGKIVNGVELAADGSGFREVSRFSAFRNMPELLRIWKTVADVKTAEDLDLDVPELSTGRAITVKVEPTEAMLAYQESLARRAAAVKSGLVEPTEDNMLKISSDGRKVSLDPRMVGLDEAGNKLRTAADNIHRIYESTKDTEYPTSKDDPTPHPTKGGLQIVFLDMGTPQDPNKKKRKGKKGAPADLEELDESPFPAYAELKALIAERGIPEGKIRFIHEAKNDAEKARLFADARNGKIAVLIGSTTKMGVGTNVQLRATALHHLDCPWRPADLEQRNGRIIRQGNVNPEVSIFQYVTEQSFDGFSWQTVARKAKFIRQLMKGNLTDRTVEDIPDGIFNAEQVTAMATGNPYLLEQANVRASLGLLTRQHKAYLRAIDGARATIHQTDDLRDRTAGLVAKLQAVSGRKRVTRGDAFNATLGGKKLTSRKEASAELARLAGEVIAEGRQSPWKQHAQVSLGEVGGVDVVAKFRVGYHAGARVYVADISMPDVPGSRRSYTQDMLDAQSLTPITRLEDSLAGTEANIEAAESYLRQEERNAAVATERLKKPFEKADELETAQQRSRLVNAIISAQSKPLSSDANERAAQRRRIDALEQQLRDARIRAGERPEEADDPAAVQDVDVMPRTPAPPVVSTDVNGRTTVSWPDREATKARRELAKRERAQQAAEKRAAGRPGEDAPEELTPQSVQADLASIAPDSPLPRDGEQRGARPDAAHAQAAPGPERPAGEREAGARVPEGAERAPESSAAPAGRDERAHPSTLTDEQIADEMASLEPDLLGDGEVGSEDVARHSVLSTEQARRRERAKADAPAGPGGSWQEMQAEQAGGEDAGLFGAADVRAAQPTQQVADEFGTPDMFADAEGATDRLRASRLRRGDRYVADDGTVAEIADEPEQLGKNGTGGVRVRTTDGRTLMHRPEHTFRRADGATPSGQRPAGVAERSNGGKTPEPQATAQAAPDANVPSVPENGDVNDAPKTGGPDAQPEPAAAEDGQVRRYEIGDEIVTPDGPGSYISPTEDGQHFVNVQGRYAIHPDHDVHRPGEQPPAQAASLAAATEAAAEERRAKLDQASTPEGLAVNYGGRLHSLDQEAGHGWIADEDGNTIGWVRSRPDEKGRTAWWGQDARGGAPEDMTWHDEMPAKAGIPPIRMATHVAQGISLDHRGRPAGQGAAWATGNVWKEVTLTEAQVRELAQLAQPDPEEPIGWKPGVWRRYQMRSDQMRTLRDAARAAAEQADATTAAGRRQQKVLRNAADKLDREAYETDRTQATLPRPGEPDPFAQPYSPPVRDADPVTTDATVPNAESAVSSGTEQRVPLDPEQVQADLASLRPGEPHAPAAGSSGEGHSGAPSSQHGEGRPMVGDRPVTGMNQQELDDELSDLDAAVQAAENSTDPLALAWRRRAELRRWEVQRELNRKTVVEKPADRGEEIESRLAGQGLRADEGEGRNVERIEDMPAAKPGSPSDADWEQIDAAAAEQEEYPPTPEQTLIHEAVARRGLNTAVMALAGTGKSSTLKQLSRRMPGKRIAYLAFNRSVAEEAKQAKAKGEYADNVTPQTANGMAFQAVNKRYQDAGRDLGKRLPQDGDGGAKRQTAQTVADLMRVYDWVEYAPGKSLKPSSAAYQARDLVSRWCQSSDEEMGPQHLSLPPWIEEEHREALFEALKPIAERMWEDILDPHGKLTYDQDYIVKQWALSGFKVDTDVIFFDEAQDVNPVLDGVVRAAMKQGVQVVAVGDSNQSIYGFRGATDALARFPVDARLTLTQSFRFGPQIAEAGNRFLRLSGTEMRLKGLPGKESRITELGPDDVDAVLCRTNATAVIEAIDALDRGKRVAVAGGLDEIRKFVEAARQLQAGEKTNHKDLADFAAWDDVVEYVEQESEAAGSMRTLVQLIENDTDGKLDRLLESGGLASDIRVSDDGERLWISGTRFGDPDHEAFTRWLKDPKANGFGKLAWDDQSKRWYYQPGTHTVTNRKSGRSWTVKNPAGNRDTALAAVKAYIEQHSHAPEDGEGGIVGEHQNPDVVISTAHKSKGLEWRRVRIAGDFRGPEMDESGKYDLTTMPSDEDLRLSYVAVTRATEALDAGGLGWVWEVTRSEDPMEAPDTDYPRDWTREDFTPGDTVLYVSDDGEQVLTGDVVKADTVLTVRDPQTGRTSTISMQQVRRRNGDPQPRADVASDDELQAAIDSGRYTPPGSGPAVVEQHDPGSGSAAEDRSTPVPPAGDGVDARSTGSDATDAAATERSADVDWADAQRSWEEEWSKKPEPNADWVRSAKRSLATSAPDSTDPAFALRQSKNPTMKFSPMGHFWVWTEDGGKTWSITTRALGEYVGDPEVSKVAGTEEDAHRLALAFESIKDGKGTTLGLSWDISRRADEVRDINGVSYEQRMRQARTRFDADRGTPSEAAAGEAPQQLGEHVKLSPEQVDADLRSLTAEGEPAAGSQPVPPAPERLHEPVDTAAGTLPGPGDTASYPTQHEGVTLNRFQPDGDFYDLWRDGRLISRLSSHEGRYYPYHPYGITGRKKRRGYKGPFTFDTLQGAIDLAVENDRLDGPVPTDAPEWHLQGLAKYQARTFPPLGRLEGNEEARRLHAAAVRALTALAEGRSDSGSVPEDLRTIRDADRELARLHGGPDNPFGQSQFASVFAAMRPEDRYHRASGEPSPQDIEREQREFAQFVAEEQAHVRGADAPEQSSPSTEHQDDARGGLSGVPESVAASQQEGPEDLKQSGPGDRPPIPYYDYNYGRLDTGKLQRVARAMRDWLREHGSERPDDAESNETRWNLGKVEEFLSRRRDGNVPEDESWVVPLMPADVPPAPEWRWDRSYTDEELRQLSLEARQWLREHGHKVPVESRRYSDAQEARRMAPFEGPRTGEAPAPLVVPGPKDASPHPTGYVGVTINRTSAKTDRFELWSEGRRIGKVSRRGKGETWIAEYPFGVRGGMKQDSHHGKPSLYPTIADAIARVMTERYGTAPDSQSQYLAGLAEQLYLELYNHGQTSLTRQDRETGKLYSDLQMVLSSLRNGQGGSNPARIRKARDLYRELARRHEGRPEHAMFMRGDKLGDALDAFFPDERAYRRSGTRPEEAEREKRETEWRRARIVAEVEGGPKPPRYGPEQEDSEHTAADAEQPVPRRAAGHDARSGRREDQDAARHGAGSERDRNAGEQLGGENEGNAEEADRRRQEDQEDGRDRASADRENHQGQGVDAERPQPREHRDREADHRALDDRTAAEQRDGEHDSEHGSGEDDESDGRERSRRRRRDRRGRPDGTNGGGPDLDGLGAPDVPLIGLPLPKGSSVPGGHEAEGEGVLAGRGNRPSRSRRSAGGSVRRAGKVQPPTGVVASHWNPEEGGQVPNVVGRLAAAAGGHPDDAKEWNALLGEASAAAPLAQFDANVEHFLAEHDGPMREFLAERARLLRAEAEAARQRATADYLERLRAADNPAAGEAVYFGSYRGDGRRGSPGIIGEGRYYEELREAFARQRAQARAEAEQRGLDADAVERFLLHADGADPDQPAAISAHSVEEPLNVARHDAFYAMVANLPETVRRDRFPGTLEEHERRSALIEAALQGPDSSGRQDRAGELPVEPASGATAAEGVGAAEERLARVRERFTGGEGIPGSSKNRAYVARLGSNPTLGVSPGGGVAYWSKDGGRTWEFGHARTGATIGSRDGSSVEGSREDAAAMAARYEGLVDAEGRPFPWDVPDARAAGRGWRDAEGRRIGEAMRAVRDEHAAPQERDEVPSVAADLADLPGAELPTMDGGGQKLPDDLAGVDEGVLEAHLAVLSDQVAAAGDWGNPDLHRIADELDRRAAERGDYWRALASLAAQASDAPPADDVSRAAEEELMDQLAGLYPTKETRREYLERVEAERQRLRHQYDNEYRPTIRSAVEDYTKGYLVRRESAQKARAARVKQEAEDARAAAEGRPSRRVANGLRIDDPDYMLFEAPQSVFDKHASDELREWIEYHNGGERPVSFSRYYQQHLAGERQARAQWEDEQDAARAAAGSDESAELPVVNVPGDGLEQRPPGADELAAARATTVEAEPEQRPSAAVPAAGQRPEAEQQDGVDRQKRVKDQGAPNPIGGRPAQWVAVEQLRTGDVARVEGSDENGNPIGRSGWVLGRREAVITRGGRTIRGHEVTVGDDAEGTSGRRGVVFVAAGEQAARADALTEQGSMLTGAQLEAMTGRLDGDHPTDRNGVGLFPGSLVRGPGDREGMVTGVTASAVSVRYDGRRHDQDAAPGDLEVVDGGAARPAGWTPDGQHIKPGQVAVDPDTRQPVGVVQTVDGDAVEVATPQGVELADGGSLTVARGAQPDEAGPAIVALRPVPAGELAQGDVVLVDDAGRKTPVKVVGQPVRDGEHVVVDYEEVGTGTRGQLRADRALLLPRATGASGQPADLSPQEAVTGIDDTRRVTPAGAAPQADAGIVPELTPAERARIHALGLGEADEPEAVEAAERIEAGQPVTVEQARALEEALRQHADPRTGEGRTAGRAADRLARAAGARPQERDRAPVRGTAGDLVPGDVVAVPQGDGTSTPVVVTDSRPGPGGTQSVTVEDAYGLAEEEVLPVSAPVHHLPAPQAAAPGAGAKPAEAAPSAPSGAPAARPRTSDVVASRARDAVDAVVEAAVEGVVPGTIHALRQSVAERLAPGARRGERHGAADAAEALRRLGLDEAAHAHAEQAVRHAAQKAREAAVKAVLRTLNDLEPLDGESEEETAQRAVRLLRRIPEGIDPTTFALVAMARSYRATARHAGSAPGAPPSGRGEAAAAAGQRAGATTASFAGRAVGSALAVAASMLRRRRLDQQQVEQIVQRTVRAMAEGQEQAAREIVDGVPSEARPGLFSRVMAALVRLARRVAVWLRELLRKVATVWRGEDGERLQRVRERLARRLRWWPETREIEADVAAAAGETGGSAEAGVDLTPWLAMLPAGRFGQVERTVSHWGAASTADLEAGRLPEAVEERRWTADRAVDGGPGPEALRHLAAVLGAGEALDAMVTDQMRQVAPELGSDPHGRLRSVHQYAQTATQRADRIAAEAAAGSRDAELELDSARAEARQAVADERRAQAAYAAALRGTAQQALGRVRQLGDGGGLRASGEGAERLRGLEAFLPADWLAAAGPLTVSAGARRGSYHPQSRHLTVGESDATALHALAHHLQHSIPELAAAEEAYHWVRTSRGEVGARERAPQIRLAQWFPGRGHHPRATARQGGWADMFTGSEPADGRSWEVLPTALEAMFSGSTWYLDDDLRQWLLGVMSTLGRRA